MALRPVSQVRVYNRALALVGTVNRSSNTDDGKTWTDTLNEHWDAAVRDLQAAHPWNCCVEYAQLNRGPAALVGGYTYQLPADCLRWLPWGEDSEHYFCGEEKKGRKIVADAGAQIIVRYIALNEDMTSWPPHLVTAMAYRLAMDAAEALTQSAAIVEEMRVKFEGQDGQGGALDDARQIDGLATGNRNRGNVVRQSRTLSAALGGGYPRAPGT